MNNLQIFESKDFGEIQIIEEEGKFEFDATGIAKILGYTNPHKAIIDHCKKDGLTKREVIDRLGRKQEKNFISEGNLYRLITHSKLPDAEKFEKWVFDEVLPNIRKTGMYIAKPKKQYHKPIDKAIKQHFNIAETFIQATGVKPELVYAVAINEAEKETGYSYDEYKKLLPSAKHDVASYNPTQIGELLGNSKAKEINKRLEELGLQEKKNNVWRLTEQGRQYGEEKPFSRFGHTDYRILWHEKVVEVLEVK